MSTYKYRACSILFVTFAACAPYTTLADIDCDEAEEALDYANYAFELDEEDRSRLGEYCKLVEGIQSKDPEYLNIGVGMLIERTNGLAFLRDIDFKIKAFQEEGADTSLGFSYNYTKTNPLGEFEYRADDNVTVGTAWTFSAKGNVAFDRDTNPKDFLDTRFAINGFRDWGGVSGLEQATIETARRIDALDVAAADMADGSDELAENRNKAKALMSRYFTNQFYLGYDLNLGLESDQDFDSRQLSYGGRLVLDAKGYEKNSALGKWNILDYPFALIRIFSGYGSDTSFRPLGSSFPTFLIGLDQVDPSKNKLRKELGETDRYERGKAEIYFRTPVASISGHTLFANLDYRHWYEFDASDAVKEARLDKLDYFTFSISSQNGVYVSYADGKLPFDLADTKVYELGWKFHLD